MANLWNSAFLDNPTSYNPPANGLVESFHRMLKADIMRHAEQQCKEVLPLRFLGFRTAFIADLQASVSKIEYGKPLRIPGELLTPVAIPVEPENIITRSASTWST
jgi:hypothetical protein